MLKFILVLFLATGAFVGGYNEQSQVSEVVFDQSDAFSESAGLTASSFEEQEESDSEETDSSEESDTELESSEEDQEEDLDLTFDDEDAARPRKAAPKHRQVARYHRTTRKRLIRINLLGCPHMMKLKKIVINDLRQCRSCRIHSRKVCRAGCVKFEAKDRQDAQWYRNNAARKFYQTDRQLRETRIEYRNYVRLTQRNFLFLRQRMYRRFNYDMHILRVGYRKRLRAEKSAKKRAQMIEAMKKDEIKKWYALKFYMEQKLKAQEAQVMARMRFLQNKIKQLMAQKKKEKSVVMKLYTARRKSTIVLRNVCFKCLAQCEGKCYQPQISYGNFIAEGHHCAFNRLFKTMVKIYSKNAKLYHQKCNLCLQQASKHEFFKFQKKSMCGPVCGAAYKYDKLTEVAKKFLH